MNKSQEIRAIQEIAKRMQAMPWSDANLVLGKLAELHPSSDHWNYDAYECCVALLEEAPHEALRRLLDHLGLGSPTEGGVDTPVFWRDGRLRVFVSHVSETQRHDAAKLQNALQQKAGITAFVAHEDIQPGSIWEQQLYLALQTCHVLVGMISPEFHQSVWCNQEVGIAKACGAQLLPIRMGADPRGFMGAVQGLKANGDITDATDQIFKIIYEGRHRKILVESTVRALEESESWVSSRHLKSRIQEVQDELSAAQIARLRKACETNIQVGQAFGVPEMIQSLKPATGH